MKKISAIALLVISLCSCNSKQDYDQIFKNPDLYSKTVYQLNSVVMGNNFSPIVASRNYLYAAVAGYEVIAGGHPDQYNSLAGQLHGLGAVPKPTAGEPIDFEMARDQPCNSDFIFKSGSASQRRILTSGLPPKKSGNNSSTVVLCELFC